MPPISPILAAPVRLVSMPRTDAGTYHAEAKAVMEVIGEGGARVNVQLRLDAAGICAKTLLDHVEGDRVLVSGALVCITVYASGALVPVLQLNVQMISAL